jgi:hypothetical protein
VLTQAVVLFASNIMFDNNASFSYSIFPASLVMTRLQLCADVLCDVH